MGDWQECSSETQTFWLVLVVMARPLGRSRAILCFLIICTDTTGMTTCQGRNTLLSGLIPKDVVPLLLAQGPSPSWQ